MKNMSASIRARILNIARKEGISFQRLLTLYNQEGLLHRIVSTEYKNAVVLKGGLLFFQLQGIFSCPTKDIDLLGEEEEEADSIFRNILHTASTVEIEDGLVFKQNSIDVQPIAGQTEHGGVRGFITGYLGTARTRLHIDMGFGDVITGGPILQSYKTLLENRSFSILTYSHETVAAEKLEAVISLGIINSRHKDLFDLFYLLTVLELPENRVVASMHTFQNRKTSLPKLPKNLTDDYWRSTQMITEWTRHYINQYKTDSPITLCF